MPDRNDHAALRASEFVSPATRGALIGDRLCKAVRFAAPDLLYARAPHGGLFDATTRQARLKVEI